MDDFATGYPQVDGQPDPTIFDVRFSTVEHDHLQKISNFKSAPLVISSLLKGPSMTENLMNDMLC